MRLALVSILFMLATAACQSIDKCEQPNDAGSPVQAITMDVVTAQGVASSTGYTVPLHLTAQIQCLVGLVNLEVTSSVGSVGGSSNTASITMVPENDDASGIRVGDAVLIVPLGATTHLTASIGDASATLDYTAPLSLAGLPAAIRR